MSLLRNITAPRRERRKSAVATQNLSILLSAYACEPDSGSEPGVGWQWAINLARMGNRVCVITWEANRDVIEASPERQQLPNLRFVYLGLPRLERCLRNGGRAQRVHYFFWQLAEFLAARRVARSERFDIAHHVTYTMARVPSLMGLHGIPFVFGPVAGGD